MSSPPLVFLDTQQWRYLDEGPTAEGPGLHPAAFLPAARSGRVRVVASVDLIGEIVNAANWSTAFVDRVVSQVLDLAGPRVLQPLPDRIARELAQHGMLPTRKRYLSAPERQALRDALTHEPLLRAIADEARAMKEAFEEEENALRDLVLARLTEAGDGEPPKPATLRKWYATHDREEWVREILDGGQKRGLFKVPDLASWDYRQVPSVYTFLAFRQARMVQTIGERRRIQGSDLDDAFHTASGAYFDVLVTDDKAFGSALDAMSDRPFRWMRSRDFSAAYLDG